MSSDVVMDHLVEDRREFVGDVVLELGGQASPELRGGTRHSASHCSATAKRSLSASDVSFVGFNGRGAVSVVVPIGRRKVMWPR